MTKFSARRIVQPIPALRSRTQPSTLTVREWRDSSSRIPKLMDVCPTCGSSILPAPTSTTPLPESPEADGKVLNGPFDTPFGQVIVAQDPQGAVFQVIQPS